MHLSTVVNQLLEVPSLDPEDARRRKLLNILLLGLAALIALALLAGIAATLTGTIEEEWEGITIIAGSIVMLIGIGVIFGVNRYWRGGIASTSFLLLLVFGLAFSDTPQEVADGRVLFIFTVPIIMASVLLRPYASFFIASLSSMLITVMALSINIMPNFPAILGFFALALVSWLSARSLERALDDLRAINRELDQRVVERTQDLAEALDRVQAESSKNQAILEGIADGVIVFDHTGKAIVANPAVSNLLYHPTEAIIDHDIREIMGEDVGQDDQETVLHRLKEPAARQDPSYKLQWGNKMLSVSFAPVYDNQNQTSGTVAVFRDFTREAELDRMKSTFVSMASHELRTPLNAILGYSDMLKEDIYGPLTPDQKVPIKRVIANSRRMLSLVNNLLDQAQIEAGKLSLHFAPFSLRSLLEVVESVMSVLAEHKGLDFVCTIEEGTPSRLNGDVQRLEQILINLAGNAIKFTQEGEVRIHVYCLDDDHWAIDISDTGPGIPKEAQPTIFDRFQQVDGSVTRKHQGSGLGLAIVKQLSTLMSGSVSLDSEPGKGSTFTVVLPHNPPKDAHEQKESRSSH